MAKEYYQATVSRNDDPKMLGRIRVTCDALAERGKELPFWVEPVFPFTSGNADGSPGFGWFGVPDVGSEVELEATTEHEMDETPGESFFTTPDVKYRAAPYSPANPPPEEFKTNYPRRRGVKTPGGHTLIFDDEAGTVTVAAQDGTINLVLDAGPGVALIGKDVASATSPAVLGDVLADMQTDLANQVLALASGPYISPLGPCFLSPAAATALAQLLTTYIQTAATNILSTKLKLER